MWNKMKFNIWYAGKSKRATAGYLCSIAGEPRSSFVWLTSRWKRVDNIIEELLAILKLFAIATKVLSGSSYAIISILLESS